MPSTTPNLLLFIPQLFQPLKLWHQDFGFIPKTPVLSLLLQTIKSKNSSSIGLERSLFSALGLPIKDELPIARYRYDNQEQEFSDDQNREPSNHNSWETLVCADPVHCEVGMKDITLTHIINDLTFQESDELVKLLNQHFSEDGFIFLLDKNKHWYLALSKKEAIKSSPIDDVIGKNVFPYLPESNTRNWQQIQNEVQMLLHVSSLNQSREIAGLPTINNLWFWGGGEAFSPDTQFEKIYGGNFYNSTLGSLFARASKSPWQGLPESGKDIVEQVLTNRRTSELDTLIILDQLIKPSHMDNIDEWQQQVTILEENFLKPLMDSWIEGEVNIAIDTCEGQRVTLHKTPMWNVWFKKIIQKPPRSLLDVKL